MDEVVSTFMRRAGWEDVATPKRRRPALPLLCREVPVEGCMAFRSPPKGIATGGRRWSQFLPADHLSLFTSPFQKSAFLLVKVHSFTLPLVLLVILSVKLDLPVHYPPSFQSNHSSIPFSNHYLLPHQVITMKFAFFILAVLPSFVFSSDLARGADSVAVRARHQQLARALPITPEARREREAPASKKRATVQKKKKRCKASNKPSMPLATGTASATVDVSSVAAASATPSDSAPAGVGAAPTFITPSGPVETLQPSPVSTSTSDSAAQAPTTSTPPPAPTTTSIAPPPPPPTTSTPPPAPATTSTPPPAPTTSASSGGSDPSDPLGILTGTHSGDGTFYATGLGACGWTNADTDYIAAVSWELFDNYPGYSGANPNNNPVCGRMATASYGGQSVTIKVVDRCTGCDTFSLDFSPSAFDVLADPAVGRILGMEWVWAD